MALRALTAIIAIAISGYIALLPTTGAAKGVCGERNFQCGDGRCIPLTWACEGEADCSDGSDESPAVCKGGRIETDFPAETSTEASTAASVDVVPLAEPPVVSSAEAPRTFAIDDEELKMAQRLPIGGVLEASNALRLVGMVHNLPLQFLDTSDRDERRIPCSDDDRAEHRIRCGKVLNKSNATQAASKTDDEMNVDDGLDEEVDFAVRPDLENRRRKQKPKRPSTQQPIKGTTSSCCKQIGGGGGDDDVMRRETARLNLDVLRRLASMLNEEKEKFAAERQMLGASRDMMMAETRRVNSERGKIDSEKQKVDLEKDLLQSQMLGRRSPRFNYLSGAPVEN